jgi:hypothetical protein
MENFGGDTPELIEFMDIVEEEGLWDANKAEEDF